MKSFFFVPGDREDFIQKSRALEVDHLVFDLEDAVSENRKWIAVNQLLNRAVGERDYLRVFWPIDDPKPIQALFRHGHHRFILPKVKHVDEVDSFLSSLGSVGKVDVGIVVLLESPLALYHAPQFAQHPAVVGLGLGSYDYFEATGMEPLFRNVEWHRHYILNTAKAFGKMSVDVASMNVTDSNMFKEECESAKSLAFDGKFLIHPWQLNVFNGSKGFSFEELVFARKVKKYIMSIGGLEHFSVTTIDGRVIEKPHIPRINNILMENGDDRI